MYRKETQQLTIFEYESTEISRHIDICIEEENRFRMDMQDLGPAVDYDENEYERSIKNIDVNKLYELFQVHDQESLFRIIAQRYGNEHGFDQFKFLINSKNIEYDYWAG